MVITFNELKEKEVINVADGKRLGRVEDVLFDKDEKRVVGVVVPGERKLFKKVEDVFIPIEELKRIGEDVILVKIFSKQENGNSMSQALDAAAPLREKKQIQKEN